MLNKILSEILKILLKSVEMVRFCCPSLVSQAIATHCPPFIATELPPLYSNIDIIIIMKRYMLHILVEVVGCGFIVFVTQKSKIGGELKGTDYSLSYGLAYGASLILFQIMF